MEILGPWSEVRGRNFSECFLQVAVGAISFWLCLVWRDDDPWHLYLAAHDKEDARPGLRIDRDVFLEEHAFFSEEELCLAEFAAVEAARAWINIYWDEVKYELDAPECKGS